ncbi:MAG: hypothetical protein Kow00108_01130 [Calditrichia bacterium]
MAKLTPLEIKRQSFKKVIRGYDPEEVEVFIEMVADQFEELLSSNEEMKETIINLQAKLEEYQKNEKNMNEILEQTKKIQEDALANLKQREEVIIKEAELKAVEILDKAQNEVRNIKSETRMLQERKDAFVSRLKYLLQSYIDLIKMLESENLLDQEDKTTEERRSNLPEKEIVETKNEQIVVEEDEFINDLSDLIDKIELPDDNGESDR